VRRRLVRVMPNLTHWFGLMPWDLERLTPDELNAYIAAIPKDKTR